MVDVKSLLDMVGVVGLVDIVSKYGRHSWQGKHGLV